jgi:hypothetical protein
MMLGCKFTRAVQTLAIEVTYGFIVSGITPLSILKHFNFLIAVSTWMRTVAIRLVMVEAFDDTVPFLIIGGAINLDRLP